MGCWLSKGQPRGETVVGKASEQGLWGRRKDADVKDGKFLDLGAETNSGDGRGSPPGGAVGSPRASKGRAADVGNFVVSGLTGKTVLRTAGQIAGQQFVVQNCTDCTVLVMDGIDSAQIDDCRNCRIFLGPASGSVFVRDCDRCAIVCACHQFRLRDCTDVDGMLLCRSKPAIESCSSVRFGCLDAEYPGMADHLKSAGLDPLRNFWSLVFDFTADENPDSWEFMSPFVTGEELLHGPEMAEDASLPVTSPALPDSLIRTWGERPPLGAAYGDAAVAVFTGPTCSQAAMEVARRCVADRLSVIRTNHVACMESDWQDLVPALRGKGGAVAAVEVFGPKCGEQLQGVADEVAKARTGEVLAVHVLGGKEGRAFCKRFMHAGIEGAGS